MFLRFGSQFYLWQRVGDAMRLFVIMCVCAHTCVCACVFELMCVLGFVWVLGCGWVSKCVGALAPDLYENVWGVKSYMYTLCSSVNLYFLVEAAFI